jgi:hypothetical protein
LRIPATAAAAPSITSSLEIAVSLPKTVSLAHHPR